MAVSHNICSYSEGSIRISKLTWEGCGLVLEVKFLTPRLYAEGQRFVELLVLVSRRLKEKQAEDEERKYGNLTEIEAGRILPKHGM